MPSQSINDSGYNFNDRDENDEVRKSRSTENIYKTSMYYASKMSEPLILDNFKSRITKPSPEIERSFEEQQSRDSTQEVMINHYLANNQKAKTVEEQMSVPSKRNDVIWLKEKVYL